MVEVIRAAVSVLNIRATDGAGYPGDVCFWRKADGVNIGPNPKRTCAAEQRHASKTHMVVVSDIL